MDIDIWCTYKIIFSVIINFQGILTMYKKFGEQRRNLKSNNRNKLEIVFTIVFWGGIYSAMDVYGLMMVMIIYNLIN